MYINDHCKTCLAKLGNEYRYVHVWLDAFAHKGGFWMGHRMVRHHDEGIEDVRAKWGDQAAEAARLHIQEDEGEIPTKYEIERRYSGGNMHNTIVCMKDGRKFYGPIWNFRPKEGWFSIVDDNSPAKIMFRDVASVITKNERVNATGLIADVDELSRARENGWDGK